MGMARLHLHCGARETVTRSKRTKNAEDRGDDGHLPRLRVSLDDLETFLTVADAGGFSRAAEQLGLSQPSVTNRIQRLESLVGVKLFARTTRMVVLTSDGERLRTEADKVLRDLRRLINEFHKAATTRKRTVTVATTPFVAAVALPSVINQFQASNPRIRVVLTDLTAEGARSAVESGAVDMAVMVLDGRHPDLKAESLTIDECVVVTPLSHPLNRKASATFDDIRKYPILMPDMYVSVRRLLQREFERRGVEFRPAETGATLNNISTLLGMVAAGMGITMLPRTLISLDRRDTVGIVSLEDLRIVRHYRVVTRRDSKATPAARAFIRFLHGSIKDRSLGWPT
jgi:LysR family carnitine catabolism transcriptional activator